MNENKNIDLKKLNAFLRKNQSVDFRQADLVHQVSIDTYKWTGLENEKDPLLRQLKAYQRLLRVLPDDMGDLKTADVAKAFLTRGVESALQITGIPKKAFVQDYLDIVGGNSQLIEQVYQRAIACRKGVTLRYMNRSQLLEPHAQAAGLNR